MKKKILIGSIFATIILLLQMVIMPPVLADGNENGNFKIKLEEDQKTSFETVILNFQGSELYEELNDIYQSNLDENDEFDVSGLIEMIEEINDFLENTDSEEFSYYVLSINEVIKLILGLVLYHIAIIPVAVLFEILQDASDLFNYYADLMMEEPEFILALALNKFLPNVYDMLIELEIIKDYYVDLPDTPEEKKQYIKDKFNYVIQSLLPSLVITSVTYFYVYYAGPMMGYLGRMAQDIIICLKAVEEIVKDYKVKLEHFRDIFIDLPVAFIDFIKLKDHEIIPDFIALINAIKNAKNASEEWLEEFQNYGPEVLIDLGLIVVTLTDLIYYYTQEVEEPWLRPISVIVSVEKEEDETIQLSFEDPDQTYTATIDTSRDHGEATLIYQTNTSSNPYGLHSFKIIATSSNGGVEEKTGSAFSEGSLKLEINHKPKTKSKTTIKDILLCLKERILNLFENLLNVIFPSFSFFENHIGP